MFLKNGRKSSVMIKCACYIGYVNKKNKHFDSWVCPEKERGKGECILKRPKWPDLLPACKRPNTPNPSPALQKIKINRK